MNNGRFQRDVLNRGIFIDRFGGLLKKLGWKQVFLRSNIRNVSTAQREVSDSSQHGARRILQKLSMPLTSSAKIDRFFSTKMKSALLFKPASGVSDVMRHCKPCLLPAITAVERRSPLPCDFGCAPVQTRYPPPAVRNPGPSR